MTPRQLSFADYVFLLVQGNTPSGVHLSAPVPTSLWFNEETKDVRLDFAVAGYSKSNLHVKLDDGVLEVSAEAPEVPVGFSFQHGNLKQGPWTYRVRIPDKYDPERTTSSVEDGVLRIVFSLREENKPKLITLM